VRVRVRVRAPSGSSRCTTRASAAATWVATVRGT
jgi:hypothetical protein